MISWGMKSQSVKKHIRIIVTSLCVSMFYLTCHLHGIEEWKTKADGLEVLFLMPYLHGIWINPKD